MGTCTCGKPATHRFRVAMGEGAAVGESAWVETCDAHFKVQGYGQGKRGYHTPALDPSIARDWRAHLAIVKRAAEQRRLAGLPAWDPTPPAPLAEEETTMTLAA